MDNKKLIESGILELYVAGVLSEKENIKINKLAQENPEVNQEILAIEIAIIRLTEHKSLKENKELIYKRVKKAINNNKQVTTIRNNPDWSSYYGWAAALIIGVALFWSLSQNYKLKSKIEIANNQQKELETKLEATTNKITKAKSIINILRNDKLTQVSLIGQGDYKNTHAKVYWNKKNNYVYLDTQGLPAPPKGMTYQLWSLTLNPLTPTNLGTIEDFAKNTDKIFEIENKNNSEAFGITLEPLGGSKAPTMAKLYTLGIVTNS